MWRSRGDQVGFVLCFWGGGGFRIRGRGGDGVIVVHEGKKQILMACNRFFARILSHGGGGGNRKWPNQLPTSRWYPKTKRRGSIMIKLIRTAWGLIGEKVTNLLHDVIKNAR